MRTLRIFVSHSFADMHHRGGLEAFRGSVARALNEVQRRLSGEVRIDVVFAVDRYGEALFDSVIEEVRAADLLIVDLNGLRPNVILEAGVRIGAQLPLTIVADKAAFDSSAMPADLAHLLVGLYDGPADLVRLLAAPLVERLGAALSAEHRTHTRDLWFGEMADEIHIICSPEPERSTFANRENPNYLFIDNLEDRDSLIEVAMLVSRLYPASKLIRHSAASVAPDVLRGNVIVIGGPGFEEQEGNLVAREFIQACGLRIRYLAGANESMEFHGDHFVPAVHSSGRVDRDYGYFARVKNPLNRSAFLVLAQGVYTAGTLGACVAFTDSGDAISNQRWLRERLVLSASTEFEALLEVSVGPWGAVTPARTKPIIAFRLDS